MFSPVGDASHWWSILQPVLVCVLDGQVMAERYGSVTPRIIALHGWGRTRHDWAKTLAGLDALALDLPGFGASAPPSSAMDTAGYAELLHPLLSATEPVVLVGHSFGGRVAVQLARRWPEKVTGLVLTGVPLLRAELGGSGRPKLAYRLGRWLHRRGVLGDAAMASLREKYGSADYRQAQGVLREILVKAVNEDYTDALGELRASGLPIRLVWGENDTAAPLPMARHAAELLGDAARLDVVPGSAHLLDAALEAALRQALSELDAKE